MISLIDRMFSGRPGSKNSSQTAKERLKFVLIHDRIHLPPEKLREMEKEILAVISKYVKVDVESVEFALQQRERKNTLVAEIPFKEVKGSETLETTK